MNMSDSPATLVEYVEIAANGIAFHAATAGPRDGPLLLLLHGFPEFSYGWRHQIGALAEAGFRVVAPDQRGYGGSAKPFGAWSYRLSTLANDVVAIADALGHTRFSLIGHDWGGIVAWRVASDFPERVSQLAIINAPNLDVTAMHMVKSPGQLLKSSYVALFQVPLVPELVLSANRFALLAKAIQGSSLPGTFSDAEMDAYKDAWGRTGALTAMLDWYRALSLTLPRMPKRITVPTQIIWGDQDSALDSSLAEDCLALCDAGRVHHIVDATHWVHHERSEAVNALLLEFLDRRA